MAFTRTWNTAYEAIPAGSDKVSTADDRIRDLKSDIRERMSADHYMLITGDDTQHGQHNKVTIRVAAYAGSGEADKAIIHAVNVGGKARPVYTDEDGTQLRMVAFAGGNVTKTTFFQTAAPLGWSQVTTYDNAMLKVVDGSGGGSGGSTDCHLLDHIHTMPTHTHTLGTHNHNWYNYTGGTDQTYNGSGTAVNISESAHTAGLDIAGAGLDFDAYTSNVNAGPTNATDPGDTDSTLIRPKYINVILCSLD